MSDPVFNPPPNWPKPPDGWAPPSGWKPDPSWPPPPDGWELWITPDAETPAAPADSPDPTGAQPCPAPLTPQSAAPGAPHSGNDQHDAEALAEEVRLLRAEVELLRDRASLDGDSLVDLDDERVLQEVGIYNYHHPLGDC